MTNYEKYFGTPETAADSIAGANNFAEAWGEWKAKADKLPATLIPDVAKGKVSDEYYRSLSAESLVRASLERINLDKRQIDIMRETIRREYGGSV